MRGTNSLSPLLRKVALAVPFNPREYLMRSLGKSIKTASIVLDATCGHGGNAITTKYRNKNVRIIGFDIFRPYVYECKSIRVYDELLVADVRHPPFRNKSVDVVYFTETIEHLKKEDGYKALKELERIARKAVLVTTPIGFHPRVKEEIKDGNVYQLHRSGWFPSEFRALGYEVWGRYPRFLRKLLIILNLPIFSFLNLAHLPCEKSTSIVALKIFHE